MAWTTATEVIAAWIGNDAPSDTALVGVWVDKAERHLRSKVPNLRARIDAGATLEPDLLENVKDVVTAMVQRVFRNPEGVRQRQEGTGPFTGSVTYGGDQPGGLLVTTDELALLVQAGSRSGAFSISMIPATSPYYTAGA
jgi:NADPH-dependent 2,4-dienoyl-CoA reductase/sulfur reductase-like enzyme